MSNPKDDEALAEAINDRTIPVSDPAPVAEPIESREPEEAAAPEGESGLGKDVSDFEIDVPPPEGI